MRRRFVCQREPRRRRYLAAGLSPASAAIDEKSLNDHDSGRLRTAYNENSIERQRKYKLDGKLSVLCETKLHEFLGWLVLCKTKMKPFLTMSVLCKTKLVEFMHSSGAKTADLFRNDTVTFASRSLQSSTIDNLDIAATVIDKTRFL